MTEIQNKLDNLAEEYLILHKSKEDLFWDTRMGISQEHMAFQAAEIALREFLSDASRLKELRSWKNSNKANAVEMPRLDGWIEFFSRNVMESDSAKQLQRELIAMESLLEQSRAEMKLGFVNPQSDEFEEASSVRLASTLRSDPSEERRKAAWEGLRSIENHVVANGFGEVVSKRNQLARELGYSDYYEYKVQWAEGFDKTTLFHILDELCEKTGAASKKEFSKLIDKEGEAASKPWNYSWFTSGSVAAEKDPWFRFEDALGRWIRSFSAMGIRYRDAKLKIDLIDRKGKYENGFMHGPVPAFFRKGQWQAAEINFTANAVPDQAGAGQVAMTTLFHEGGHAAHFANITRDAPCFSQEFAPTSTAFAETQSMLLDSLLGDADWQSRYATNSSGKPLPFSLIEKEIRLTQPGQASMVRRMLAVSYFEKALYEMSDSELTESSILDLCRATEKQFSLFEIGSPRPLLSIPHLLSGDASCYYHGYVLASVALEQTKSYLLEKHGTIVDNPKIGPELSAAYWEPGNSTSFLNYIKSLTGKELSSDALANQINMSVEDKIAFSKVAIEKLAATPKLNEQVQLNCDLSIVHGDEIIWEGNKDYEDGALAYQNWILNI